MKEGCARTAGKQPFAREPSPGYSASTMTFYFSVSRTVSHPVWHFVMAARAN
jgi:hypothetical protein